MSNEQQKPTLHWDDSGAADGRWWMSRARENSTGNPRDVFVAEDDMTDALIGLMRVPPQSHYTVLAACFLDKFESRAAAAHALKQDVAVALMGGAPALPVAGALRRWRFIRTATLARKNFPFLLLGLVGGGALGLAVAMFAVWTGFVGWPFVVGGIVLGGAAGYLMKMTVDAFRAQAVAGPWGRFAIIMLGVIFGAGATAAGTLLSFWH